MDDVKIAEDRTLARRTIRHTDRLRDARDLIEEVRDDPDPGYPTADLTAALELLGYAIDSLEELGA